MSSVSIQNLLSEPIRPRFDSGGAPRLPEYPEHPRVSEVLFSEYSKSQMELEVPQKPIGRGKRV